MTNQTKVENQIQSQSDAKINENKHDNLQIESLCFI